MRDNNFAPKVYDPRDRIFLEMPGTKYYDFSTSDNAYTVSPRHQLIIPCIHCGFPSVVTLDADAYYNWARNNVRTADAFPHFNVEQKDLLIAGIHLECSAAFYGKGE